MQWKLENFNGPTRLIHPVLIRSWVKRAHNKKLSCCGDSRSYCVYWQTIKPVSVTSLRTAGTPYARSDSTGRAYERTQTLSTQAWPL